MASYKYSAGVFFSFVFHHLLYSNITLAIWFYYLIYSLQCPDAEDRTTLIQSLKIIFFFFLKFMTGFSFQ